MKTYSSNPPLPSNPRQRRRRGSPARSDDVDPLPSKRAAFSEGGDYWTASISQSETLLGTYVTGAGRLSLLFPFQSIYEASNLAERCSRTVSSQIRNRGGGFIKIYISSSFILFYGLAFRDRALMLSGALYRTFFFFFVSLMAS